MGLLDQFFGNADQTAALGLLGANVAAGNAPAGFLAASQHMAEAPRRAMQTKLLEAQIAETLAQSKEREQNSQLKQRRTDMLNQWMGQMDGAPSVANQSVISQTGNLAPTLANAALQSQAFGRVTAGNPLADVDPRAARADMMLNEGKNIPDWLFKRTTPDMQVSNGFAFDKNRLNAGFMPSLNTSQDGKTSMVQIDPNTGLPVVSAPSGALNTYAGYRNVDESAKANFDPVTVTPQGQPPQMTSRGALMRNPQAQGQPQTGQSALDAGRVEILNQEVTRAKEQLKAALQTGDATAAQRATNDLTALNKELGRAGGTSRATVGIPLQSDAEKASLVKDAENSAARDAKMQAGAVNSRDTLNYINEARALFKKGPTASGLGSVIDSGANLFGMSTPGADAAAQLDTLSGWMVSNVPRMEGPQSNYDVQNYKTMAGMVGDRTQPLSQRIAALDTLERLQEKYAHLNGSAAAPASPPAATPKMLDALPNSAPRGQRVRDTATGKVLQFNGARWIEEK